MDAILIKKLNELIEAGTEVALVTVTNKTGSGPRDSGSMMLVDAKGQLLYGTIGGGGVEEQAKKDALKCIENKISKSCHYELSLKDTEASLHMACGGVVDVFIKVFTTKDKLVVFGAGHIGLEMSFMASRLGYHVIMIDERADYANIEKYPHVDQVLCGDLSNCVNQINIDAKTSIVIITHGHEHDMEALELVVHSNARYIGMIGSKNKVRFCLNALNDKGIEMDLLRKVYAPIGLKIGGSTPAEIALSILSEIQAVKFDKHLPMMKDTLEV
jgi:xanthine dehydrogenase accessory factor